MDIRAAADKPQLALDDDPRIDRLDRVNGLSGKLDVPFQGRSGNIEADHIVARFRRFDRMFQGMGVIGIEEDRVVEFLAQAGDHGDSLADTDEVALALGSADQYWHFQSARGTRHRL